MQYEIFKNRLTELFDVRNDIAASDNIEGAAQKAINISIHRLNSQVASVYLFSKDGFLTRIRIGGYDKNGLPIDNNWFANEKYEIGASFTGKVVNPISNNNYGEPQLSNNLELDEIDVRSRNAYKEKLGDLKCAISVPLNGRHRTYGAIEVINKLTNKRTSISKKGFVLEDVFWLTIIGINLASVISQLRRKNELGMLADISKMLVEPFGYETDPKIIYQQMAQIIVGPLTSYKACIIRISDSENHCLKIAGMAGDDINWDSRVNDSITKGERLAGKVFQSGKPQFITNIQEHHEEFKNMEWISLNNLKSFACFPLIIKNRIVGTMSLFTKYEYQFYENEINFLHNIAYLIGAYTRSAGVLSELQEVDRNITKIHGDGRSVGYDTSMQKILHSHKHELLNIQHDLEKSLSPKHSVRRNLIEKQTKNIINLVDNINAQFEVTKRTSVNTNILIQDVLKSFMKEIKNNKIQVIRKFDSSIPEIVVNEKDLQEIIYNIISNAIKSIIASRSKSNEVEIETKIIIENDIEYIQISVSDNGIGIRNEIADKIYERNYTEFKEGTGIGLFITKEILDGYGGNIFFKSTVGKGSTFFVQIPLRRYMR